MSNFEKKLNSRKNLRLRTIGLFVVLIIIGILAYYFPKPIIYVAAALIAVGIYFAEKAMHRK